MPKPKVLWLRLPHTHPLAVLSISTFRPFPDSRILLRFPIVTFCLCLPPLLSPTQREPMSLFYLKMSGESINPPTNISGIYSTRSLLSWVGHFPQCWRFSPWSMACYASALPLSQAPTLSYFKPHFLLHCSSFHPFHPC